MQRGRVERTASKRWRGSVRQILAAATYNLSCFTHGCSTGWVSGVLGSEALAGGAWLAALPCLVALPAAPFFAFLADAKGRKTGAFCICLLFIISCSLAAWGGPKGVWVSRAVAGAGSAGALALAPLYCAEIAPRSRGLAALPAFASSCGILFTYAGGGILSPHSLSLSMALPPSVLLVSLIWLPETPTFLIRKGKMQHAARVMCWFDGSDFREDVTDMVEQQEVRIRTSECYGREMRRQDSEMFQPMLKRSSGLDSNSDRKSERSPCWDLFIAGRSVRALLSCWLLVTAGAGSGVVAINSFVAAVLAHSTHAVPNLNISYYNFSINNGTLPRAILETSEAGSMLCGTALVLGAAIAIGTVDKVGRKTLLLLSCSGIACCLAVLGFYCDPDLQHSWLTHQMWPYKKTPKKDLLDISADLVHQNNDTAIFTIEKQFTIENLTATSENLTEKDIFVKKIIQSMQRKASIWPPVILVALVLFFYNIGLGSVPYVLISEIFSIHVRSLASSLLVSWMWLSSFLLLRYFGTIAILLGLHNVYFIGASFTALCSAYILFIIPETKGKSQEEIDRMFKGPLLLCIKKKRKNEVER